MPRPALWTAIADTLRAEIGGGVYAAGDRLPSEGRLAARFGVNRHTVRRALATLGEEGLVHSRRGAGAFVTAPVTDYPIGRRVRFHRNLLAAGRTPDRRVLTLETCRAGAEEAEALGLAPGAPVHLYAGLSLADGVPIALFRSVFPAGRLPGLIAALGETPSVTRALAACGVHDYTRVSTRITATPADAAEAAQLRLAPGAALLRTVSVNADPDGRPVEFGRSAFAGDRVSLTLEAGDGSAGPAHACGAEVTEP